MRRSDKIKYCIVMNTFYHSFLFPGIRKIDQFLRNLFASASRFHTSEDIHSFYVSKDIRHKGILLYATSLYFSSWAKTTRAKHQSVSLVFYQAHRGEQKIRIVYPD